MPKSKHRKLHKLKSNTYKINLKLTEKARKKKLMEEYIKMQQEILANAEAHTSTEDVSGPEINVDELTEDWNSVDSNLENVVEVENVEVENVVENVEADSNDNNNK
ncbi:hypothetical protein M0Q97_06820 [Candidatus Dojkabacteria bacterium]|jgi:hypothetical protein|nr:hypothetical protein [Candidatus Dojkabacteria bacterium]